MAVTVTAEPWGSADGAALRAQQRRELDDRYGSDDHESGAAPTAEDITVFLVARTPDGQAVGCGALRQLDSRSAEIKRMFVSVEVLQAFGHPGKPAVFNPCILW